MIESNKNKLYNKKAIIFLSPNNTINKIYETIYRRISMKLTDNKPKMHFISNIYRFIFSLILITIAIIIIIIYYNFSRQNRIYNVNYNMSAVTGLTHTIEEQEQNFMKYIKDEYIDYYLYKEGLFSAPTNDNSVVLRQNIYRFLDESFSLNSQITSMSIYSAYDDQIYSVTKSGHRCYPGAQPEFVSLISTYNNPLTILKIIPSQVHTLLNTSPGYSFLYCLRDTVTYQNIGAIQVDYSKKGLKDYLSINYPGVKGDFLIFDSNNNILFDTTNSWNQKQLQENNMFLPNDRKSGTEILIYDKRYYMNMSTTSNSNIYVIGLISHSSLWDDIQHPIFLILIITFSVTAITLICVYFFIQNTTSQLHKIYFSMLEVKKGNLNTRIPTKTPSKTEFDDISIAFNDMLENLNDYIDKVFKSEIESQKYQLKLLQSQINPHFLYNTLETIRMKAMLNDDSETNEMIYILSKILRNSIKGNSMVSVREEIENCKNYLRLCDIQYKNLLHYSFEIDNRLLSETIIQHALIIMIENYIIHGFDSSREDNTIIITGQIQNSFAIFNVKDNGFGIKSEDLISLNQSFTEKSLDNIEKIGLKNIYQRAHLLYGDSCNLQVLSTWGKGTEIAFSFTLKKSET